MMKERNKKIKDIYLEKKEEAGKSGYYLNPDKEFTGQLLEGILLNEKRYGYQSCPCRLASGKKDEDLDIICPCYYRDEDIDKYGNCYCGLYVNKKIAEGKDKIRSIPERRYNKKDKKSTSEIKAKYPVFRCRVCGYLCAKNNPPAKCPICGALKERFETFLDI